MNSKQGTNSLFLKKIRTSNILHKTGSCGLIFFSPDKKWTVEVMHYVLTIESKGLIRMGFAAFRMAIQFVTLLDRRTHGGHCLFL